MKAILLVAGIAALLASPAMAQQTRPQKTALPNIPKDARASVAPSGAKEGGPYTPSIAASRYGASRDFQNGSKD
jgi:opacity protein-like surface antigen